jgi:isoleucyl-tRNA synthetase
MNLRLAAHRRDLYTLISMAEPLELKKTLNLPKTDFPMKASLPQNEPKQLAAWQESRLYDRILEARKGKPLFVFHDGPPYPTGEIHLGTGLNKILKDLVVKTKSMAGHYAPYVPGWDCHGLPIETQVEKELGGKGKVPPAQFRKLCREFAARFVEQHKRDFQRLGVFARWSDPYLTMSHEYEATIAGAFLDFTEKGYVYRGRKPVYWCIYDSTALAEAEVEYEDHTSPSIWVKFSAVGGGHDEAAKIGADVSAVIWTTTPWTLPHNRALAFHPDFEYAVVDTEKGALLLASERVAALQAECGIKEARVRATFKGRLSCHFRFRAFSPLMSRSIRAAASCTRPPATALTTSFPGRSMDWKLMRQSTIAASISKACQNTKARTYSSPIPLS